MTDQGAVIDASAVTALLVDQPPALLSALAEYDVLNAPSHIDLEVMNSLRGLMLAERLSHVDFSELGLRIADLPVERHAVAPLLPRALSLAYIVTAYDAAYIALAEGLGMDLVTKDVRLSRAPGIACRVVVV